MDPEAMKTLELDKVCRCCLTVKKEMRPLFPSSDESSTHIARMLEECAQIQVEKTDGWPDKICMQCVHQISRFHSFKFRFEKLDQQLREYIKGLTVVVVEEPPPVIAPPEVTLLQPQPIITRSAPPGHQIINTRPTLLPTTTPTATAAFPHTVQLPANTQFLHHNGQLFTIQIPTTSNSGIPQNPPQIHRIQQPQFYEEAIHHKETHDILEEVQLIEDGEMDDHHNISADMEEIEDEEGGEEEQQEEEIEAEVGDDPDCVIVEVRGTEYLETEQHQQKHQSQQSEMEVEVYFEDPQESMPLAELKKKTASKQTLQNSWIAKSDEDEETKTLMMEFVSSQTSCPSPGKFVCNLCRKDFMSSKWLYSHMESHSNWIKANCKKQPECGICQKKFQGPGMLKMHMKTHEERTFKCELCSKSFQNEYHLNMHLAKHKNASGGNFKCEPCGKSFISANELRVHKRSHNKSVKRKGGPGTIYVS